MSNLITGFSTQDFYHRVKYVIFLVTCQMKDGLEADAKMSHLQWITVLNAL